jgi:chorismate dehydratase
LAQKIKVGAVSYLNTKPLIYGFEQGMMLEEVDLLIDHPANIAAMLQNGTIDIGLIPVAAEPGLDKHYTVSDYGIACNGEVASVCLFSDVPLAEIKTIILDYQSRTSVALLKLLLCEHWKINPLLIEGTAHYENEISGSTAGLVIGDRAFTQRLKNRYMYDLGFAWKEMTGLPFVFATWVSNCVLSAHFIAAFNDAIEYGLKHLDEVVNQNPYTNFDLKAYYTQFIQFRLNEEMLVSKDLFLKKIDGMHV